MTDDYTPPIEDVRNHYAYGCGPEHTWQESREDFDRFIAALRAEWEAEQGEPEWEGATARGFGAIEFDYFQYGGDSEPERFSVQESSLATQRKVWIGMGIHRAHLNEVEAARVRDALNAFLAGAVPDTTNTESEGKS